MPGACASTTRDSGSVQASRAKRAADARRTPRWPSSTSEYAIGSSDVTVIGWSLGSAVAVDLAVRRRLDGLVLLSPMTSIVGVLLDQLGIRSPGASSVGPFNSVGKISRVGCDVLIISGRDDRICPPYMAADLARRLGRSKVGQHNIARRGSQRPAAPRARFVGPYREVHTPGGDAVTVNVCIWRPSPRFKDSSREGYSASGTWRCQ